MIEVCGSISNKTNKYLNNCSVEYNFLDNCCHQFERWLSFYCRVHVVLLLSQLVTDGDGRGLGSSVRRGGTVVSAVQRLWGAAAVAVPAPVASTASTPSPCLLSRARTWSAMGEKRRNVSSLGKKNYKKKNFLKRQKSLTLFVCVMSVVSCLGPALWPCLARWTEIASARASFGIQPLPCRRSMT